MPEIDASKVINRLSAALDNAGAGWLVREVSVAVQEGRAQEKVKLKRPVGRRTLHPVQDDDTANRRTGEYTRSLPYSPEEQLGLLTGAILGVFADSATLNEVLVEEFGMITFQSEGRFSEEETFVLDETAVLHHRQAKSRVEELIQKISENPEG